TGRMDTDEDASPSAFNLGIFSRSTDDLSADRLPTTRQPRFPLSFHGLPSRIANAPLRLQKESS
uniref:hypothetical protein n=1 Tax=uncultured Rhizobium sp. TaxID=155567 RepID=UPI0026376898